jgi:hypothetical protein
VSRSISFSALIIDLKYFLINSDSTLCKISSTFEATFTSIAKGFTGLERLSPDLEHVVVRIHAKDYHIGDFIKALGVGLYFMESMDIC